MRGPGKLTAESTNRSNEVELEDREYSSDCQRLEKARYLIVGLKQFLCASGKVRKSEIYGYDKLVSTAIDILQTNRKALQDNLLTRESTFSNVFAKLRDLVYHDIPNNIQRTFI